jgi:aminoglycoside phosphotransferase family enzyme/predicted kinase
MRSYLWHELITKESLPFPTKEFKVLQTHISYVFITDEMVYKIKKPVNFGFLDFTTLEKRRFYCEREVELNKRLCPDIYLGVVPVIRRGKQFFIEDVDRSISSSRGEVLDYAVKMKRLPEEGMMKTLLAKGSLTTKHIDLIVKKLVPFYQTAETNEEISKYGSLEVVSYNIEENFSQTKDFVGKALTQRKFETIVSYSRRFMEEHASLFEKRIKKGFIRDGHGDLYSANICFDYLREVYIFDCIEFNERFRCGDVCSDLAFLAMDLDFYRLDEFSKYFIDEYVKRSGDKDLLLLLDFYKCYRAFVRGKIGCFTSQDQSLSPKAREEALSLAQRYFDLAFRYAKGIPKVLVFMGLSCTGKTYLAERMVQKYPAVYLSSDVERKKLLGLDPEKHYYAEFEQGIYSPEVSDKTYEVLAEEARIEVSYGRDVIIDATFRKKKWQDMLFSALKDIPCEVFFIWCVADDEVVKERFSKRATEKTASDALFETYLHQKKTFEPPVEIPNLLKIDTSSGNSNLLKMIEEFIKL